MERVPAVSDADRDKILVSAGDYIEAWLDGDATRMAGCLHPALVKRAVIHHEDGTSVVDSMSRDDMVTETGHGYGTRLARPYEVEILDAFEDIATVRLLSSAYMDYLHLARFEDRWLLLNVLWRRRPTT